MRGGQHKIISIGIGDACINQDLAVNTLHQPMALWDVLDKLEPPDVILASPPCESWSVASAMKGGNACWKQEQGIITSLFGGYEESSKFTIRNKDDYSNYNTLKIIDHYKPKIFVIENPAYGRIWEYIANVIGFNIPYENLTYYNNYGYPVQKATKFGSNINLKLRNKRIKGKIGLKHYNNGGNRYNTRSNIPIDLVKSILKECEAYISS